MNDHEIVRAIQKLMSGNEWSADTLDEIAIILEKGGYHLEVYEEKEPEPAPYSTPYGKWLASR